MRINVHESVEVGETLTVLARIPIDGQSRLAVVVLNAAAGGGEEFDQFQVRAKIAGTEITYASAGADFTTPVSPLVNVSGDLTVLAAAAIGNLAIDCSGLDEVSLWAATAAAVTATGVLTAAANATAGGTVTIGPHTYTFDAALVDEPFHVLIGVAATNTLDNLIAAINAAAGAGTTYGTGTTENPDVNAAAGVGDTVDLTAVPVGKAGNLVPTTSTDANLTFGAATLTGGSGPSTVQLKARSDLSLAA